VFYVYLRYCKVLFGVVKCRTLYEQNFQGANVAYTVVRYSKLSNDEQMNRTNSLALLWSFNVSYCDVRCY